MNKKWEEEERGKPNIVTSELTHCAGLTLPERRAGILHEG